MAKLTFCVPSYVAITNPQLVATYWLLFICMGVVLAVRFFMFESYLSTLVLDDMIRVNFLPALPHQRRSWADVIQSPLCASSASFHYVWDAKFGYYPSGCSRICKNASDDNCVEEGMAIRREINGRGEAFIATLNQVTTRDSMGAVSRHSTFLPEAEQIRISVGIACEGKATWTGVIDEVVELCSGGPGRLNTLVVLLNSRRVRGDLSETRQVNRTWASGEVVPFVLAEILWLAGIEGGLTDPTVEKPSRPATLGGTEAKPPALAVAGMILQFVLQCYNFIPAELQEQLLEFNGFVCTIAFVPLRSQWVQYTTFDRTGDDGAYREVYSTGLRIVSKASATFTFLDIDAILGYLINSSILMKVPRILVLFFCTAFLGHLSHIYSRAILKHFDIEKEVAGMATRLLGSTISFRELHRIGSKSFQGRRNSLGVALQGHGGTEKITHATVKQQLKQALQERETELDATEVSAFVEFVYHSITAASQTGRPTSVIGRLSRGMRRAGTVLNLRRMSSVKKPPNDLGMHQFNIAHASIESIDFNSVCRLFNADRRVYCLEKLFTPSALRHAIFNATLPGDEASPQADEPSTIKSEAELLRSDGASSINGVNSMLPTGSPSDAGRIPPRTDVDASQFGSSHAVQHVEIEARLELFRLEVNSRFETMSQSIVDKIAVAFDQAEKAASRLFSERLTEIETHIYTSASKGSSQNLASAASTAVQQGSNAPQAAEEGAGALAKVVENLQLEVRKLELEVDTVVKEQAALAQRQSEWSDSATHRFQRFSIEGVGGAMASVSEVELNRHPFLESSLQRFSERRTRVASAPSELSSLRPEPQASPVLPQRPRFLPSKLCRVPHKTHKTSPEGESRQGPSHAKQKPAPTSRRQPTDVVIGAAAAEVARRALALPPRGDTGGSKNSSAAKLPAAVVGRQQAHTTAGHARDDRRGGDKGGGGGQLDDGASL